MSRLSEQNHPPHSMRQVFNKISEKIMIIGITGGIGSGKSTLTRILEKDYGFMAVILDDIAKELEKPGGTIYERLLREFGPSILEGGMPSAPIDKEKFARIIYGDRSALKKANSIIHPAVWEYAREATLRPGLYAVETALPDEGFGSFCDSVWFVRADTEVRIGRLMASRGYTREKCLGIISNQKTDAEFEAVSDVIIDNSLVPYEELRCIVEGFSGLLRM